jgi:aspartate racemase
MQAALKFRRPQPSTVGILGGMGPAAGADFARLFVDSCTHLMRAMGVAVTDQAYPEHWLAQVPIPDRTAALLLGTRTVDPPLESMKQVAARLGALGARTLAIACNTAHAWHASLQKCVPDLEVIHGVQEVANELARRGARDVGLLATEGTYHAGVYQDALEDAGLTCHTPSESERQLLMEGIYRGVKAGDLPFASSRFQAVALALAERHKTDAVIMGCTEIPLALKAGHVHAGLYLADPTQIMARVLALRAYGVEDVAMVWPS